MDNIFTNEPTAEESAQIQAVLNETLIEMKRIREAIDRDQKEIDASQIRTRAKMSEIQTLMTNLRKR